MSGLPPLNLLNWLLALLPVILLITLMLWRHWGGSKAGAAAYLVTLLIAWLRFGAGFELLAYAARETGPDPARMAAFIKGLGSFQGKYQKLVIDGSGDILEPTEIKPWE